MCEEKRRLAQPFSLRVDGEEISRGGEILCVTNRKLCGGDFLEYIEAVARASRGRIGGIILREKDLPETEYRELAGKVAEICKRYGVRCILHNFPGAAKELGAEAVHLPLPLLRRLRGVISADKEPSRAGSLSGTAGSDPAFDLTAGCQNAAEESCARTDLSRFRIIGASCHSVQDALEAQALGCTYITAGHVFATDCKKGVPPHGLAFLREVCESVSVPVYAIGGIDEKNYPQVLRAGAAGACIMSGLMRCGNVEEYVSRFAV